jgi:hypothetical protein
MPCVKDENVVIYMSGYVDIGQLRLYREEIVAR